VKAYALTEIQPVNLTPNQKNELDKRFADHHQNKDSNMDAFEFLNNLKSKYEL
jgi:hypothetical protein